MLRSTCSPTRSKPARILCGPVRGGAPFGPSPSRALLPRPLSLGRRRIPIPSATTVRSHRTRSRGRRAAAAYGKDELLGYLEHCRKKLDAVMAGMTAGWGVKSCPFDYSAMRNGDLLLYNMEHWHQHAP